jgi:hypothetical protein
MIMKLYVAIVACLILGSASAYGADSPASSSAASAVGTRHGACAGDIQKFCADVEHGKGKIRECLVQRAAELTPGCRMRVERYVTKAD